MNNRETAVHRYEFRWKKQFQSAVDDKAVIFREAAMDTYRDALAVPEDCLAGTYPFVPPIIACSV
jgi:thiamine biosynthesis protein ThiC